MTKPYDLWLTAYKNTQEHFAQALQDTKQLPTSFAGHALIDLHFNLDQAIFHIQALESRIYELEQTLDGREPDPDTAEVLLRSQWAWPEKEED